MKETGLFIPLIVFFGVFLATRDILYATASIMVVVSIQVFIEKLRKGKVQHKLLITWVLLMIFGSATLLFRDPIFIQWKLTIVNWIFAIALIVAQLFGKKPIKGLVQMSGALPELPDLVWRNIAFIWSFVFFFIGTLNLYFVFYTDISTWVNFKVFGTLGITIIFALITSFYVAKNLPKSKDLVG